MADKGWIKLHRKVLENPVFKKPELLQLFIYCLLRANHNETKIIWNDKEETLDKGCFITGRKAIAKDTGLSESSVYRKLKVLSSANMISLKSNNKFSVVKVLNYSIYQGEEFENEQPVNNKRTTSEQPANTNKNEKNVKNEKNINISSSKVFADDSEEIILAHQFISLILENNPNFKQPNMQKWASEFDKILRIDERSVEVVRIVMTWAQGDNFWKGNILSPKKLREKFDALYIQMTSRGKRQDKPNKPSGNKSFDAIDQWDKLTEGYYDQG